MAQKKAPVHHGIGYYLFGTIRRALVTLTVAAVVFAAVFPDAARIALSNVLNAIIGAVGPVAGPLLGIAIAVWAIWYVLLRPFTHPPKKKKGSDH